MALSIKSEEADRLARELATMTGETLTEAVVIALRERLLRERSKNGLRITTRLRRIQSDITALPVVDGRTPDEIIGYGGDGLPG